MYSDGVENITAPTEVTLRISDEPLERIKYNHGFVTASEDYITYNDVRYYKILDDKPSYVGRFYYTNALLDQNLGNYVVKM